MLNTISLNDGFIINDYGSNDKQTPSYAYQYANQHIEELKNKAIEQDPDAKLATEFNVVPSVIEDDRR